jgi:hypothetical protein
MRKNHIIAQVERSDRNIYITVEDDALVSVNYSQGLGELDPDFLYCHNQPLTKYVLNHLESLEQEMYSPELFFPSPYWDEQVDAIDDAIWRFIQDEQLKTETILKIESVKSEIQKVENMLYKLQEELFQLKSKL